MYSRPLCQKGKIQGLPCTVEQLAPALGESVVDTPSIVVVNVVAVGVVDEVVEGAVDVVAVDVVDEVAEGEVDEVDEGVVVTGKSINTMSMYKILLR